MLPKFFIGISVFLLFLLSAVARAEGFGTTDYMGSGHTVLKGSTQISGNSNLITVGRTWTGQQYEAVIASYLTSSGAQDLNFGAGNGLWGRMLFDFTGQGLDNLCVAVVAVGSNFVAACRSENARANYDIFLVKFSNSGSLVTAFGTSGIVDTGYGTVNTTAFVRGIAYDGTNVAIVGGKGYSSSSLYPYIATFNATTGAVAISPATTSITGQAVGVVWDGSSHYYMASTQLSTPQSFYVDQFTSSLSRSSSPWGSALSFSAAGGGTESLPAAIAVDGGDVIVIGGNETSAGVSPWRCAIAAVSTASGGLDTSFGRNSLNGATGSNQNQGVTLFTEDFINPNPVNDCILNTVAIEPGGSNIYAVGTGYNGTNYDYLAVKLNSTGVMINSTLHPGGSADDVLYSMLFANGSTSNYYGIGRSQSASLYNGGAVQQFTNNGDGWVPTTTTGAPVGRSPYNAVLPWTGSKAIVWGGVTALAINTGGLYDPINDNWTPTTTTGAPSARYNHGSAFTGSEMIVWGGGDTYPIGNSLNTGGVYDPAVDTWAHMTTTNAPQGMIEADIHWTGSKLLVWGGASYSNGVGVSTPNTGGLYDPAMDTWSATTTTNASLNRITQNMSIWTGTKLVAVGTGGGTSNQGGIYDPSVDTWKAMTTINAPAGSLLSDTFEIWTGTRLLFFGSFLSNYFNNGGQYDPLADSWSSMTQANVPSPRSAILSSWTGSRMLVWSGENASVGFNSGGVYDPSMDTWSGMANTNAPSATNGNNGAGVWTGAYLMVVVGDASNAGGLYSPGSTYTMATHDTWTAATTTNAPTAEEQGAIVWTGSQVVVWSGYSAGNSGGRYDPTVNTWAMTTTTNAPATQRSSAAYAWTGSLMLVWGGTNSTNTGGRYDPVMDTWAAITTTHAPRASMWCRGAWAGNLSVPQFLVWGGNNGNVGGRYDPVADTWKAITTVGAPAAPGGIIRDGAAAWAGNLSPPQFLVWGGSTVNTGGLYDPAADTWVTLTTTNSPQGVSDPSWTWTGSNFLVWGGYNAANNDVNTGGLYDPVANTWAATTTTNAPPPASNNDGLSLGVWSGSKFIVWGGEAFNTGGQYDPVANTWTATTMTAVPALGNGLSSVWIGNKMLVFGGLGHNSAAMYTP